MKMIFLITKEREQEKKHLNVRSWVFMLMKKKDIEIFDGEGLEER